MCVATSKLTKHHLLHKKAIIVVAVPVRHHSLVEVAEDVGETLKVGFLELREASSWPLHGGHELLDGGRLEPPGDLGGLPEIRDEALENDGQPLVGVLRGLRHLFAEKSVPYKKRYIR